MENKFKFTVQLEATKEQLDVLNEAFFGWEDNFFKKNYIDALNGSIVKNKEYAKDFQNVFDYGILKMKELMNAKKKKKG